IEPLLDGEKELLPGDLCPDVPVEYTGFFSGRYLDASSQAEVRRVRHVRDNEGLVLDGDESSCFTVVFGELIPDQLHRDEERCWQATMRCPAAGAGPSGACHHAMLRHGRVRSYDTGRVGNAGLEPATFSL